MKKPPLFLILFVVIAAGAVCWTLLAQSTAFEAESVQAEVVVGAMDWQIKRVGIKGDSTVEVTNFSGALTLASQGGKGIITTDEIQYASRAMQGDGSIAVNLAWLAATNKSAKAGLMIRETLNPDSRQVSLMRSLEGGLEFGWREEAGSPRESVVLPGTEKMVWLRIVRRGDWFGGFGSIDGANWTLLEWRSIRISQDAFAGAVATGGVGASEITQAQFENLQVGPTTEGALLPKIGAGVGLLGEYHASTNFSGPPAFVRVDPKVDFNWGFGTPIGFLKNESFGVRWSGEIEAQFTENYTFYLSSDDGARVWLDENLIIDDWQDHALREAKANVSLVAGQRYKIRIEYYDNSEVAAVKLSWSSPSTPQRVVPKAQLFCVVPDRAQVANLRAPSWAELTKEATGPLASPWEQYDVGTGKGGGGVQTNGVKVVRGVGFNVGGRADAFHFVYQPLQTNAALVVQVLDIRSAQPWSKAGLMIRENLSAGSKHVSLFGTAGHGLIFNHRPSTNRETFDSTDLRLDVPYWLKLVRHGNVFSGYSSTNGEIWRLVERVVVDMTNSVYVGFAVSSRSQETECVAWFDQFQIQAAEVPEEVPVTGSGDGLKAEFFAGADIVGKPVSRWVATRLDFTRAANPSVTNTPNGRLSAQWSGEIQARYTEPYVLSLLSRYGARVWLNEKLVADSRQEHDEVPLDANVEMVAGEKYLLRIETYANFADGKVRFIWSSPSTPRRTVPQSQLYSVPTDEDGDGMADLWERIYRLNPKDASDAVVDLDGDGLPNLEEYQHFTHPRKADTDEDGIPDQWEILHELSPIAQDDAGADGDFDGLSNKEEFLIGSDPNNSDTDADGLSDGNEVLEIGSDPLQNEIDEIRTVAEVSGTAAVERRGEWAKYDHSLVAVGGRGWVEYVMTVPKPDVYRIEVIGKSGRTSDTDPDFELLISVDGEDLGRTLLTADASQAGSASRITPWLKAGDHRVRVFWDNAVWGRSLVIDGIRMQELMGQDANGDGIKDWVERRLKITCAVQGAQTNRSVVSPAFVEGRGSYLNMMNLSGGIQPQPAPNGRWYANLPLTLGSTTTMISSFQNEGISFTNQVIWQPLNLLDAEDQTIRKGDALAFLVTPAIKQKGQAKITITGVTNYTSADGQAVIHKFLDAGSYTVVGTFSSGAKSQSRSIKVKVVSASLDSPAIAWVNKRRDWTCVVGPEIALQSDSDVQIPPGANRSSKPITLGLSTGSSEMRSVVARIGTNGPVVTSASIEGFNLFSGFETGVRVLERYEDGSELIEMGLVISPVRSQVVVKVEVHAAGVLFDDGTSIRMLAASDFDDLGRTTIRFVRSAATRTSVCHRTKAFQAKTLLGVYP